MKLKKVIQRKNMKIHSLLGIALCTILFSCNDDLNQIGSSIQSDNDKIELISDSTFNILSYTSKIDRVYMYTINELLGNFSDPYFGTLKTDFMTQFYPAPEMNLEDSINKMGIDSLVLQMKYASFIGDSLAPLQLTVYQLNGKLPSKAYSDINPSEYCDLQTILGRKSYIAADFNVPDSVKKKDNYAPIITVTLSKEMLARFNDAYKNNKEVFSSREKFINFFPGIYVTNTYGTGSILNIGATSIRFYYKAQINDTTVVQRYKDYLNVTPEIVNVNHIINTNPAYMEQSSMDTTYIKAPAGLTTEISFPTNEILEKLRTNDPQLKNTILNAIKFSVSTYLAKNNDFGIIPPDNLLFIRKNDRDRFFFKDRIVDNKNVFLAKYNKSKQKYDFGNIANYMTNIIQLNPDTLITNPDIIELIPVSVTTNSVSGTSSTYQTVTHITKPSLVKLKKKVDLSIVYSKRK